MKKIITPVGTSIFTNFLFGRYKDKIEGFNDIYKPIARKSVGEWDNYKEIIEKIKREISIAIKGLSFDDLINISAEIKSLYQIYKELKDKDLDIYLLCTDTIDSKLAAEIVKNILEDIKAKEKINFNNIHIRIISSLNINSRNEFNKGMGNLIAEIYSIANDYWDNVIFNITGGFKATIPYLTILAQINRCLIYYIFEGEDALIHIPVIPLKQEYDYSPLVVYKDILEKLDQGITNKDEFEKIKNSEFFKDFGNLIWIDEVDGLMELNPIGKIIYEKMKQDKN
ncbi:MAG: hypothetical protein KatS3mg129_2528 [Leptospiraceae bacterium]|nr:MAG: hypothetical protein KatS3mg129_2528 [Leptospiraceae bacterium]